MSVTAVPGRGPWHMRKLAIMKFDITLDWKSFYRRKILIYTIKNFILKRLEIQLSGMSKLTNKKVQNWSCLERHEYMKRHKASDEKTEWWKDD